MKFKKITKKYVKEIMKREFDRCMKDRTLDPIMTSSIENPVMSFKFIKKEKYYAINSFYKCR